MPKKCLHKNFANKFVHTKKYAEPILVQYTYCVTCKKILKGSVTFVKAQPFPEIKPVPVITKAPVTLVKTPVQPIPVKKVEVKEPDKRVIQKPLKPKVQPIVKTAKRPDAPTQKIINPKPPRGDSDIRKNGRKPVSGRAPDETSLGDILRAKYGLESSRDNQPKESGRKKSYKGLSDPYSDAFENDSGFDEGKDDGLVFIK